MRRDNTPSRDDAGYACNYQKPNIEIPRIHYGAALLTGVLEREVRLTDLVFV